MIAARPVRYETVYFEEMPTIARFLNFIETACFSMIENEKDHNYFNFVQHRLDKEIYFSLNAILENISIMSLSESNKLSIAQQADAFIKKNDIVGLNKFWIDKLAKIKEYYERFKKKVEDSPITKLNTYDLQKMKLENLTIELFYVFTRLKWNNCIICEKLLKDEQFNWLKEGILDDLHLDKNSYRFIEMKCDWSDRFATKKHHEIYSANYTDFGNIYFYARGLLIDHFPSMRITLKLLGSSKELIRIFRGIGVFEFELDEFGQKTYDILPDGKKIPKGTFFFDIKDLVLSFLENSENRLQDAIKIGTRQDAFNGRPHDKQLFD